MLVLWSIFAVLFIIIIVTEPPEQIVFASDIFILASKIKSSETWGSCWGHVYTSFQILILPRHICQH